MVWRRRRSTGARLTIGQPPERRQGRRRSRDGLRRTAWQGERQACGSAGLPRGARLATLHPCLSASPISRRGGGSSMGFSGIRAVILVFVLVGLVLAVTQLGLPGWIVPVGLIGSAAGLKAWEKRASS